MGVVLTDDGLGWLNKMLYHDEFTRCTNVYDMDIIQNRYFERQEKLWKEGGDEVRLLIANDKATSGQSDEG